MIVITGASDGLGKALAELYLKDNKRVIGIAKSECSNGVETVFADLTSADEIEIAVKKVLSIDEKIEAFVNCAGVLSIEHINKLSSEEVNKVIDVNVKAPLLLTSRLIDRLKIDEGDIVNVASTVGTKAYLDQATYGASKWALRGFSANLQLELKDSPCRVISFCPGGFKTRLFAKATGIDNTINEGEWMSVDNVARFLKSLLELPKNMEISEVILNRKIITS